MIWVALMLAAIYGTGCVHLNGQRLRWRTEARRLGSDL